MKRETVLKYVASILYFTLGTSLTSNSGVKYALELGGGGFLEIFASSFRISGNKINNLRTQRQNSLSLF